MEHNVGKLDRIVRAIFGILFLFAGIYFNPLFYILAGVALFTAIIGWCGPYKLLGINTCEKK